MSNTPENAAADTATDEGPGPEAREGAEEPPVPPDTQEPPEGPEEGPGREAAKWRRKLREVELERDQLAGQVELYQRSEVERLAEGGARGLASGADLWVGGVELAELVDAGAVDAAKVAEAVDRVTADRPHWRRTVPDVGQGIRGPVPASSPPVLTDLMKNRSTTR